MTVAEIVADVATRLERAGISYAVGGSLASSAWGQMRQTRDADIAIRISTLDLAALKAAFNAPYYISEDEIAAALTSDEEFRSIQAMHMEEIFKIDLFPLHGDEYDESEMERAFRFEVIPGVFARFYAPENIVITKLRWFVLGNRVSDRQWNDIVQVLEIQRGKLDEDYLDKWATHFGVAELLGKARAQAFD